MTGDQYLSVMRKSDEILVAIKEIGNKLEARISGIWDKVSVLENKLSEIEEVLTDAANATKDIKQLKIDVKSLEDEGVA